MDTDHRGGPNSFRESHHTDGRRLWILPIGSSHEGSCLSGSKGHCLLHIDLSWSKIQTDPSIHPLLNLSTSFSSKKKKGQTSSTFALFRRFLSSYKSINSVFLVSWSRAKRPLALLTLSTFELVKDPVDVLLPPWSYKTSSIVIHSRPESSDYMPSVPSLLFKWSFGFNCFLYLQDQRICFFLNSSFFAINGQNFKWFHFLFVH